MKNFHQEGNLIEKTERKSKLWDKLPNLKHRWNKNDKEKKENTVNGEKEL